MRPTPVLVGGAFFLSGAAALVYQVVWQRILTLHTGIGVVSVSLIVAAFMAGLGLGSQAGGALSARLSPRASLRAFAGVELAIAAFALASPRLYTAGLSAWAAPLYGSTAGQALAHFAAFLPPTLLMGLSLPLLVRARVDTASDAPRTIAVLYGVNVLGASAGAILAPWALVRHFGMAGACQIAAGANLAAALGALAAGATPSPRRAAAPEPAPEPARGRTPFSRWLLLYAASGFVALSLEIVWFRLIDVGVKGTAFTFGTVLSIYLLGLGAGSLHASRLAPRLARPLEAFLDAQIAILVAAGGSVALLAALPPHLPVLRWFVEYWRDDPFFQLGADWSAGTLLRLYLLLPLSLYGLPTVLMGLSFGALQRAVQSEPESSGRKVGFLQAANIAGCTLGSLLTGLALLEWIGSAGTLRLLVGAGGATWLALRRGAGLSGRGLAARAAALLAVFALLPGTGALWERLHGVERRAATGGPTLVGEDSSAVSVVVPASAASWRVKVNGLPHSWLPYDGIHTMLGAVPAVVHPAPRRVVVVGLGSGETAWAVACRPETESIRVYEIAASQPRLLRAASGAAPLGALRQLLDDPRVSIEAADGRRALARTDERYDLVQADAMFRTSAGSGNLYSLEFFRLCASRLARGGIVCTQKPSRRVGLTFSEALPYSIDFGNIILGSNDPIPLDPAAWRGRLDRREVAGRFPPEALAAIRERLAEARVARRNPEARVGLNLDLFPRDEFATPAGRP
ncbi:MAG: fused MFS/spermidine synthase [Vicinamibacteria bacterium]